jgi:sulfonate transport system ATP-binding protein
VTHDVDEAIALADRILVMKHGRIADEFVLAGGEKTGEASAAARLRSSLLETLGVFG